MIRWFLRLFCKHETARCRTETSPEGFLRIVVFCKRCELEIGTHDFLPDDGWDQPRVASGSEFEVGRG